MKTKKTILVTGAAGFIGFHLAKVLIKQGYTVVGLDNINAYYDVHLKFARLNELGIDRAEAEVFNALCSSRSHGLQMQFIRMNLEDRTALPKLFKELKFDMVCNLAAQAGVRYSLENPCLINGQQPEASKVALICSALALPNFNLSCS